MYRPFGLFRPAVLVVSLFLTVIIPLHLVVYSSYYLLIIILIIKDQNANMLKSLLDIRYYHQHTCLSFIIPAPIIVFI